VNARARKIRDAADVIRVEVCDNDVADVLTAEAELFELVGRGLGRDEHRPGDEPHRPDPSWRIGAVVKAKPGVDEDQAVVGLDQQHMTNTVGSPRRMHGAAVEVMNPRCSPTRASTSPRPICVTRLAESKA
jgi:hypothetical protein